MLRHVNFDKGGHDGIGPILKWTSVTYRAPVEFPVTLKIGAVISEVSEDRFRVKHVAVRKDTGLLVAEGDSIIVSYDYGKAAKAPLPLDVREKLMALSPENPVVVDV